MAKNLLNRILSRFVEIKPGEELIASLLFLYFFLIMFPYGIIKPVRDAKYLLELGSLNLPFAYLSTAVIMAVFIHFYSKLQVKVKRRALIISSLIILLSLVPFSGSFSCDRRIGCPSLSGYGQTFLLSSS